MLQFEDSWSLTSEDRIEQAKFFKQKGTDYYKLDNYKLALKFYKKMIDYLNDDVSSIYFSLICIPNSFI
jgi:hypothetical protein